MDYEYGQCSSMPGSGSPSDDDTVTLASSCPKKRAGRKKFKETRHPIYRGVRQRNGNRWVCEVRTPNNNARIWLGTYPTAEMAARAHDVAALALRGRTACLNFADSAWRLPVPASIDTEDIQRAAAEAAEAFRPIELEGSVNDQDNQSTNNNVGINYDHQITTFNQFDYKKSNNNNTSNDGVYMDEEAMFDTPRYLASMAEGLMLPPPPHNPWDNGNSNWDDNNEGDIEVSLWNY